MVFILELNRHRSQSVLTSIADVVVPLVKVQRADCSPFQQSVAAMLQAGDFADRVLLFVPVAVFEVESFSGVGALRRGRLVERAMKPKGCGSPRNDLTLMSFSLGVAKSNAGFD